MGITDTIFNFGKKIVEKTGYGVTKDVEGEVENLAERGIKKTEKTLIDDAGDAIEDDAGNFVKNKTKEVARDAIIMDDDDEEGSSHKSKSDFDDDEDKFSSGRDFDDDEDKFSSGGNFDDDEDKFSSGKKDYWKEKKTSFDKDIDFDDF